MSKRNAVSVIMTVYNGEQYLSSAIESITNQTMTDFEFVIVDDGSTDNTIDILLDARHDQRIKVIASKRLGRSRALNLAWRNTSGDYVANLDADDLAESDRLEKQLGFLREHPGIGLLGTAWKAFVDNNNQPFRIVRPPLSSTDLRKALIRHYPFVHSSTMFTRRALERVNGYNENYRVCIDYEISTRIACWYEVANLSNALVWKRSHPMTFFSQISAWERYKAVLNIRWLAWSTFSGKINDLPHVINGWGILKEAIGRRIYQFRSRFIPPSSMAK